VACYITLTLFVRFSQLSLLAGWLDWLVDWGLIGKGGKKGRGGEKIKKILY